VDVSTKWWSERTPKQKEIILKAAKEAEDIAIGEEDKWEAKAREMCIKNGMTMIDPTPQQMDEWRKKGRSTWATLPDVSQSDLKRIADANHIKM
jgi:TRAP-type C4-dicarboxylate transport system substrate-binding protein